jgi:ankyrin repeat protein
VLTLQNGHPELVRLLIAYGADVNRRTKEGWLALNVAATECRDIKQKRKLCEYPCPHLKPDDVGIATYAQIMELLLQAGAEPNRANDDGAPALHNAILCESAEMTSSLISHGANPNKISKLTLETPLWVAARQGSLSLVEMLLEAGADPLKPIKKILTASAGGLRSRRGGHMSWFPSEIATTNGHQEVAERLRLAMREIEEETGTCSSM